MKRVLLLLPVLLLAWLSLAACKSPVPHWLWPQKDVEPAEFNDPSFAHRLLIAARRSEFKSEVVRGLVENLRGDQVYVRLVGIDQLKHAAANQYQAVVIVSTCMAWTLDPKVASFVERVRDKSRVILFTTSGDGGWLPDKGAYDALSSASRMDDAAAAATATTEAVRKRF